MVERDLEGNKVTNQTCDQTYLQLAGIGTNADIDCTVARYM